MLVPLFKFVGADKTDIIDENPDIEKIAGINPLSVDPDNVVYLTHDKKVVKSTLKVAGIGLLKAIAQILETSNMILQKIYQDPQLTMWWTTSDWTYIFPDLVPFKTLYGDFIIVTHDNKTLKTSEFSPAALHQTAVNQGYVGVK